MILQRTLHSQQHPRQAGGACSKDPKHYQKMREGDLKLEKMAALIPTKAARREVERYFMKKRQGRQNTNNSKKAEKEDAQLGLFDN